MRIKGTKLQINEAKKKELAEDIEYLRQVDLPESQGGGSKFVRDTRKEEKKEEQKKEDDAKTYLGAREARIGYRRRLADYGYKRIQEQFFPEDWEYYCIATHGEAINIFGKRYKTQEGILYIVKSPKGNVYVRGIAASHEPEYDIKAVEVMIVQIENTIDSEKGILLSDNVDTQAKLKKTSSGIYLPN